MMRVLICSSVRRALSRTSVERAEVLRVVIGLVATAHSVPTGIQQSLHRYLTEGAVQYLQRLLDGT